MPDDVTVMGVLRGQYQMAHEWLEGTIEGVTTDHVHYQPAGRALPIGANYAHAVIGEDFILSQFVAGKPPLFMGNWVGKVGVSELPPDGTWADWAARVTIDLPSLREYARAVYANTDALLAGLSDTDFTRPLDLSGMGLGQQTIGFLFSLMIGNAFAHCGEVSAIKGIQGLQGYPF